VPGVTALHVHHQRKEIEAAYFDLDEYMRRDPYDIYTRVRRVVEASCRVVERGSSVT
jgi:hypothetical protein